MLVLSRKKNESIVINNDITIVVVEIRGDKVRLGIDAPKEVPVHRREVFDAIQRNEASAADKAVSERVEDAEFDTDFAAAAADKKAASIERDAAEAESGPEAGKG